MPRKRKAKKPKLIEVLPSLGKKVLEVRLQRLENIYPLPVKLAQSEKPNIREDRQPYPTLTIKLRNVLRNENGLVEYKCQVCESIHYSEESFTRHWYLHTIYNPRVLCMLCRQAFRRPRKFRHHICQIHASHPYKCSTCSMVFEDSYEHNRHKLCHAQNCTYFCRICGMGFETFAVLEFHTFTVHVEQCRSIYTIDNRLVDLLFIKMESSE